jgi:hypothetical protein
VNLIPQFNAFLFQVNESKMNAIELKKELILRIAEIDDVSFLTAIRTILATKIQSRSINLSSAQIEEIEESRKEIEQGLFVDLAGLNKEFDRWLSEK